MFSDLVFRSTVHADADLVEQISPAIDILLAKKNCSERSKSTRGLLMNFKKTQIMVIDNNRLDHTDFMIDGKRISEVEEFVYLWSKITKRVQLQNGS